LIDLFIIIDHVQNITDFWNNFWETRLGCWSVCGSPFRV